MPLAFIFSPVRLVWPYGILGQRRLDHQAVRALPLPGDALQIVVLGEPSLPKLLKESDLEPVPKVFMGRTGAAKPFLG